MNLIKLILLTVLVQLNSSTLTKIKVEEVLANRCQRLVHMIDLQPYTSKVFGIKGLTFLKAENNVQYFSDNNDNLIRHDSIIIYSQLKSLNRIAGIIFNPCKYYDIDTVLDNSCFYNTIDTKIKASKSYRKVDVYFKIKSYTKDLFDVVNSGKEFAANINWKIDIIIKLAQAVEHLQEYGFVHRQLSPEAFKIKESFKRIVLVPILSDFKNALEINKPNSPKINSSFFTPPEALTVSIMHTSFDIFSLGRLFYFVMNSKVYNSNSNTMIMCDDQNKGSLLDSHYCMFIEGLVELMIDPIPKNRPTIQQILVTLRAQRTKINHEIRTHFNYYSQLYHTKEMFDSNGKYLKLTIAQMEVVKERLTEYSDLYELYVEEVRQEIEKRYKDPSNTIRLNFLNEHRDMLELLQAQETQSNMII